MHPPKKTKQNNYSVNSSCRRILTPIHSRWVWGRWKSVHGERLRGGRAWASAWLLLRRKKLENMAPGHRLAPADTSHLRVSPQILWADTNQQRCSGRMRSAHRWRCFQTFLIHTWHLLPENKTCNETVALRGFFVFWRLVLLALVNNHFLWAGLSWRKNNSAVMLASVS